MNKYKKPKTHVNFYTIKFSWKPFVEYNRHLIWKDKYNSPRCEVSPFFRLEFMWFGLILVKGDDQSWEQWLWVHKYNDGDEDQARSTWPWRHMYTKTSTWKDYNRRSK